MKMKIEKDIIVIYRYIEFLLKQTNLTDYNNMKRRNFFSPFFLFMKETIHRIVDGWIRLFLSIEYITLNFFLLNQLAPLHQSIKFFIDHENRN